MTPRLGLLTPRLGLPLACAIALLCLSACSGLPFGAAQPSASPTAGGPGAGGFARGQGGAAGGGGAQAGQAGQGQNGQGGPRGQDGQAGQAQAGQGRPQRAAAATASAVPSPSPALTARMGTTLAGEFAVTANLDDHSLSVVPIGQARAVASVPLDVAPRSVANVPGSDRTYVADATPGSHSLAVVSLSSATESARVDAGDQVDTLSAPPTGASGPLLVVSSGDNTVRALDPAQNTFGPALPLGAGPHAIGLDFSSPRDPRQFFLTNAGDGTLSVIDARATAIQATLDVGGRPVGAVRALDGSLWVADADSGAVQSYAMPSLQPRSSIAVGPGLTSLCMTPDGHYLVLASSDAAHALYVVDLFNQQLGRSDQVLRSIPVDGGVSSVATGTEVTLAYATTGANTLVYVDLAGGRIARSVDVGRKPVAVAVGLNLPSASEPGPATPE